ncbi:MAG TPA: PQQ-binding-like beta-propeller repeat protein [Verrucomicrobiae bacterium]|nr:PQQ-binding-like beta-propeller repeat protein [Verrucomicrobiae bacterium]
MFGSRFLSVFIPTVLSAKAALGASLASDWPEFRGSTGQGMVSGNLPLEWTTSRNVAWKITVPGQGWSSPVLSGERLFLTTAVKESAKLSLRVLALDPETGRQIWDVEVFAVEAGKAPGIHTKNSNASPTPLLAGDRLYVHFGHHGTACLDKSGKILWRSDVLKYPPVHGNGGSPVLVGSALIFSCDGATNPFVAALDKHSGKVLWKTARETSAKKKFSFSTPLVISVNGQTQIISPGSGAVCAYDPADGHEIWRVRYGEGYSVVPRPVFGAGLLFISSGFDRPVVMAIRPDGHGDVTDTHVAWSLSKGGPSTPSLLLVGEDLYVVSDGGIASCVEAKTGRVRWQERLGGNYSASPIHAGGRVYCTNEEGTTVVLKAGAKFEILATNALGERTLASPAAADGALFIRTENHLFKIAKANGS